MARTLWVVWRMARRLGVPMRLAMSLEVDRLDAELAEMKRKALEEEAQARRN